MFIRENGQKVRLHVEWQPYERYGAGYSLRKANITADSELEALAKMCDNLLLYMEYDDVMECNSVEEVIERLEESNGDGCDFITLLKNINTGEILMEYDEEWDEEEEWDEDED